MQQGFQQVIPIHLVITPEFNMLATMAFLDPFRAANYLEGRTLFRWQILSESGGDVVASNGASLSTKPLEEADISGGGLVMLSASWRPETFASPGLLAYIRRAAKADLGIGGIDTGAFLMAQAGLLVGRRATVHYEHLDTFIELYPDTVAEETLYVLDGNRMSCAGGAAKLISPYKFCGDFAVTPCLRRRQDTFLRLMFVRKEPHKTASAPPCWGSNYLISCGPPSP